MVDLLLLLEDNVVVVVVVADDGVVVVVCICWRGIEEGAIEVMLEAEGPL
jgi:hypothetical protein